MPRIVAALFETPAQAENALHALLESGVARDRISVIGIDRGREISSISGFRDLSASDERSPEAPGLSLPDDDRRLFAEGLRRGGALVMARIDGDDLADAVNILDMFDPVDLDRRSQEQEPHQETDGPGVDLGAPLGTGLGAAASVSETGSIPGMGLMRNGALDLTGKPSDTEAGEGDRRSDERADAPGVNELGQGDRADTPGMGMMGVSGVERTQGSGSEMGSSGATADARQIGGVRGGASGHGGTAASPEAHRDADLAARRSPGAASTAGMQGGNAVRDRGGREMGRTGRVRSYVRDVS